MNGAHLHLMVNHLPIIFPVVGIIVMITGLLVKSEAVKRTAFLVFMLGALGAIVAMTTGEGAEEVVEQVNAASENYIETHEETAETFALLSYLLGGLSLIGLWASLKQKHFDRYLAIATLAFSLVVVFYARKTGTSGGEISHPEIRSESPAPSTEGNQMDGEEGEEGEEEEND